MLTLLSSYDVQSLMEPHSVPEYTPHQSFVSTSSIDKENQIKSTFLHKRTKRFSIHHLFTVRNKNNHTSTESVVVIHYPKIQISVQACLKKIVKLTVKKIVYTLQSSIIPNQTKQWQFTTFTTGIFSMRVYSKKIHNSKRWSNQKTIFLFGLVSK